MSYFVELLQKGQQKGDIRKDLPAELMAHLLWSQTTGVLKMLSAKKYHVESFDISEDSLILGHFMIAADGINPNPDPVAVNFELWKV